MPWPGLFIVLFMRPAVLTEFDELAQLKIIVHAMGLDRLISRKLRQDDKSGGIVRALSVSRLPSSSDYLNMARST